MTTTTKKTTKTRTRANLKEFPAAVVAHLEVFREDPAMVEGGVDELPGTVLVKQMKAHPAWKHASESGMGNRLTKMANEGQLTRRKNEGGIYLYSLPLSVKPIEGFDDPGPEPLWMDTPPPQAPLFEAKVFADHVEISISDWIMLMQGLEAS